MDQVNVEVPKKKKPSGVQSLFWAILMFCWASYNIHRGVFSVPGWVWNGFLIAIGALNLVIAAIATFGKEWIDPQAAAKRIALQQKTLFGAGQVYRDAEPDDLKPLDRKFYARKTQELLSLGFHQMREVVNVTASSAWPRNHAVIRGFLDPAGTVYASIYHLRLFGFFSVLQLIGVIARKMQTVECETELSDGTFVATSNTLTTNKTLALPFMHRTQFPSNTPTQAIVDEHRRQLASVLTSKPGVTPTVCRDNTDVLALQDRMHALRSAFRLSPNFDHHAEWEKIAGRRLSDEGTKTVDLLKVEMNGQ